MWLLMAAVFWMGCYASLGESSYSHFEQKYRHVPAVLSGNNSINSGAIHPLPAITAQTSRVQSSTRSRSPGGVFRTAKASGVLLDWRTGKLLAAEAEQRQATPGSLLKPFLLSYALQHRIVDVSTKVYCRRTLRVAGRSVPCSHPGDRPTIDAQSALAYSCNTWFASLAQRMTAQDLEEILRQANLPHTSARFDDADTRILTSLGLENVTASPLEIATAYRTLLLHEPHTTAVWAGLRDSVAYGMANNARVNETEILGKTGTASNAAEWRTHGWFAGGVADRYVLVVYVPHGDGGTAAALAGSILRGLLAEDAR